jgi:sugar phosphate isomerase/epimerase
MTAPIALQLYTVRDLIGQEGFEKVVKKIASIGYLGVETAGFPGTNPQEAGQLFKTLGLSVCSIHRFPIPTKESENEIVDTLGTLDCKTIVSGAGPDDYKTPENVKVTCGKLNLANDILKKHGIRLGVHNHWWEYLKVDYRYAYEIMIDELSPEVFLQIDTYWTQTAGVDPATVVKNLGSRAPLLHIKDGPAQKGVPQLAVGDGVLDFPSIIKAGGENTEWVIVEMDACATDMLEAVQKSYSYLVNNQLAVGKK